MNKQSSAIILDVRTPEEYAGPHVQSSLNIDFLAGDFAEKVAGFDKGSTYLLYCRSGNRSGKAASIMKDLGFRSVENLGSYEEAQAKLSRDE